MSLTEADLAIRKTRISATDMVALSGTSPYANACSVYADKISDVRQDEVFAMTIGHALEPVALQLLADQRKLILTPGATEVHPTITWLCATPDANVLASEGGPRVAVAEAKAVGMRMMHRWAGEEPPDFVLVQCTIQMLVTRTRRAYVSALLGTDHLTFECELDDSLADALLTTGERFYRNHLVPRIPPPTDGSEAAKKMILAAWPRASMEIIQASSSAEYLAREYMDLREQVKVLEMKKDAAQHALCSIIGSNQGIQGAGWKCTWKETAETRVEAYTRKASRRFDLR